MKVKPSSPALSNQGDAPNPESVSKEALANAKASGYPKIIKIVKKIAVFRSSLYATAKEIGELIEVLENKYEVKDDIDGFAIYKVLLIPTSINEGKSYE